MQSVFIYFGDNLFGKLNGVYVKHDCALFQSLACKVFNCLKVTPEISLINSVFLGWSYAIFKSGPNVFISGFGKAETSFSEYLADLGQEISDISCGSDNLFMVTKNGCCYFSKKENFEPSPVDFRYCGVKINCVAVGEKSSLALSDDGKVFTIVADEKISTFGLEIPVKIMHVACGKEHNLLLSNSGQIFSYGCGSRGQLGHGTIENVITPLLLDALDGIIINYVSAGGWHSAAVSSTGDLYIWGWNECGQLGLPCAEIHRNSSSKEVETICCLPKLVEFENDINIKYVSCGSRHTAAITEDRQVWTWGWNAYGQLGHEKYAMCDKPERVLLPEKIKPEEVKCAFWSTLICASVED